MKIALASLAAVSLTAFAVPAAAARPDGQPDTSAASQGTAAKDGERKTCRRFENTARRTASVKICLTREGWKKFREEQEQG
jgi:hypothetical protein